MKKLVSVLLSMLLAVSLLPISAYATEDVSTLNKNDDNPASIAVTAQWKNDGEVWVNGEQFSEDKQIINCGGGTAAYDPDTGILTLNSATITQTNEIQTESGSFYAAIYAERDLIVNVVGDSTIRLGEYSNGNGIYTTGDLSLTGDNAFYITTENEYGNSVWVNGANLNVDMDGSLTVVASGTGLSATGEVMLSGSGSKTIRAGEDANGIYSSGGDVTLSGSGSVTIDAGYGIYAQTGKLELSGSGNVTIASVVNGVYANDDVIFSGSGEVDIFGSETGIKLLGQDSQVKLNGTGSPITLKADDDEKAVYNFVTEESPVTGYNFDKYAAKGAPDTSSVVYTPVSYGVWVNGEEFAINKLTISCDAGTATYDPEKAELTLENATITKTHKFSKQESGIYSESDITVISKGTNTIEVCGDYSADGIYAIGDITLAGNGGLVINAGNDGIYSYDGSVTISGTGNTKINVADDGIVASKSLTISDDGNVEIDAGYYGLYADSGDITISGSGDLKVKVEKYGIFTPHGDITISGAGNVTINSDSDGVGSGEGNLILSGSGEVNIYGKENGVLFGDADGTVLLNGTGSPITLKAGEDGKAVCNMVTEESPVSGDNFNKYIVTGAPDTSSVVYRTISYDVWVNGEQFTNNKLTINCGEGTATYDPEKAELTLENATITKTHQGSPYKGGIYSESDITIVSKGTNTIEASGDYSVYGIYADGSITLTGDGNLDIKADDGGIASKEDVIISGSGKLSIEAFFVGIFSDGGVTICDRGNVNINSVNYGIDANGGVTICGEGDTQIDTGIQGISSYIGEYDAERCIEISGSGNVTIKGQQGYGSIYSDCDVIISGSSNIDIDSESNGIDVCGESATLTIGGSGKLTVEANYYGILSTNVIFTSERAVDITTGNDGVAAEGDVEISGSGDITISAEKIGINAYLDGDVTVSGSGKLNVTSTSSDGIVAEYGNVTLSGDGNVMVNAKDYGIRSYDNAAVSGSGSVTIDADYGFGTEGDVVISGSGDVTVIADYKGIEASGDVDISGSGDVTFDAGHFGISAHNIDFSGKGKIMVKAGDFGIYNYSNVLCSGEGDVTIESEYIGVSITDGNLIISGSGDVVINADFRGVNCSVVISDSGEVEIYGKESAVYLYDEEDEVLLNGTGNPITLRTDEGGIAVYNESTDESPVAGDKFDDYKCVTGAPDTTFVIYRTEHSFPETWEPYNAEQHKHSCIYCKTGVEYQNHTFDGNSCNVCGYVKGNTYNIIAGANGEWGKGSTKGHSVTSDAPFRKFDSVKVDGVTIEKTNYTVEEGSTKVTLAPAYLETLSIGPHSVEIVSSDGKASTNFTIKERAVPTTGDNSKMLLWIALLLISVGALAGILTYRKKKTN